MFDLIFRVWTLGWGEAVDSKKFKTELMTELKADRIWEGQRRVHYRLMYRFLEIKENAGFYVRLGEGEVHLVFYVRWVICPSEHLEHG